MFLIPRIKKFWEKLGNNSKEDDSKLLDNVSEMRTAAEPLFERKRKNAKILLIEEKYKKYF